MTDLPVKTATPDFSEVSNKIDVYILEIQNGGDVSEFPLRTFELICEAYYPAETGEAFWRYISEQIKVKEDARAANLAAAEIERKARVLEQVRKAEEDEGMTVDEMARAAANFKRERDALISQRGSAKAIQEAIAEAREVSQSSNKHS
jgi:hypothetical protein